MQQTAVNKFIRLFHLKLKDNLLACLAIFLVLCVFRATALSHFNTHYLGGYEGDGGLYIWLIKSNLRDWMTFGWFETSAFHPYTDTLAWSDNFILPSMFAGLFLKFGLPEVVAFNLLILSANFLNGYFTFRMFFRFSGDFLAALVCGLTLMTSSYLSYQIGHPQLQFFFFVPLAIHLLMNFLHDRRVLSAFYLSFLVFLTFITTVYYAIFVSLMILLVLALVKNLRKDFVDLSLLRKLALGSLPAFFLLLPFLFPYFAVMKKFGERGMYQAFYFAADTFSFISAVPTNFMYGGATAFLSHSEGHLFPGIIILVLSFLAFRRLYGARPINFWLNVFIVQLLTVFLLQTAFRGRNSSIVISLLEWCMLFSLIKISFSLSKLEKKLKVEMLTARDFVVIFSGIAVVFFIVALGPLGNPEKGHLVISPFALIFNYFPGMDAVRAVARAGVIVYFCMVCLASLAVLNISEKNKLGLNCLLPLFFILFENYCDTYPMTQKAATPLVYESLKEIEDKNAVFISLPYAGKLDKNNEVISWSTFARMNTNYMNWGFDSGLKTVNGYSGQKTKHMRELPRKLREFPSEHSVEVLKSINNLKFVVFIPLYMENFDLQKFESELAALNSKLKVIRKMPDNSFLIELLS